MGMSIISATLPPPRCRSIVCKRTHGDGGIIQDTAVYRKLTAEVRHFINDSFDNVRRPQTTYNHHRNIPAFASRCYHGNSIRIHTLR